MFLSKYGVARTIEIPIIKRAAVDFAVSADWTPAAGDVKLIKDGGSAANVTNLPTAIASGNGAVWQFVLTATEMQAARVNVTVVDAATKAVEDQSFIIETYGNASAQHAFDLATASTAQTGDSFARIGSAGAGLTALGDTRMANLDAVVSSRLPIAGYTPPLDAVGTRTAVGLTSANLDTQLDALPTNAELATALAGADDATLAAIAALNNLSAAGVRAALGLASANLDTQLDALPTNAELATALAGADDATLAAIAALNNLSAAQVNAEVDTALADYDGPTHAELTAELASADDAVLAQVALVKAVTDKVDDTLEDDGGTFRFTTNALEQGPTGGAAPSAADIADAVWDESRAGHTTAGTFGQGAASVQGNVTGSIGSLATQAKADVNAEADTALADAGVTPTVTGRIDASVSSRLPTASYTAPDNASISAINAKTGNLPGDPADASDIAGAFATVNATLTTIAAFVDTEVAAIKAKTDLIPAAPAAIGDIPTALAIADAYLDRADAIELGLTPRQALRLLAAIEGGKLSGAGTATETFRNAVADDKVRVIATVTSVGARTAITYDLTG